MPLHAERTTGGNTLSDRGGHLQYSTATGSTASAWLQARVTSISCCYVQILQLAGSFACSTGPHTKDSQSHSLDTFPLQKVMRLLKL